MYNAAGHIVRCLSSIAKQNISQDEYEVIMVDDCSTDNSYFIAERFETDFKNFKVVKTVHNSGPGGARNRGVKEATGEYLFLVDCDDYIPEHGLERIFNVLEKNTDIVLYPYMTLREKDSKRPGGNTVPKISKIEELGNCPVGPWVKVFKRELYPQMPENILSEDTAWSFLLYDKCNTFAVVEGDAIDDCIRLRSANIYLFRKGNIPEREICDFLGEVVISMIVHHQILNIRTVNMARADYKPVNINGCAFCRNESQIVYRPCILMIIVPLAVRHVGLEILNIVEGYRAVCMIRAIETSIRGIAARILGCTTELQFAVVTGAENNCLAVYGTVFTVQIFLYIFRICIDNTFNASFPRHGHRRHEAYHHDYTHQGDKKLFHSFSPFIIFSPHTQAVSKKETKSQTLSLSIAYIIPVEPSLSSATPWDKVL